MKDLLMLYDFKDLLMMKSISNGYYIRYRRIIEYKKVSNLLYLDLMCIKDGVLREVVLRAIMI